jgi:2'-hydroxyisoflavone reductase
MRLLVLGGTRFLGRGIVDAALAKGDEVTTFTRGRSGEPPDGVQALHGDRTTPDGMGVLRGREWDAVVDTSGFVPVVVGRGAALLAGSVGHYVFVSSLNAYPAFGDEPIRARCTTARRTPARRTASSSRSSTARTRSAPSAPSTSTSPAAPRTCGPA